MRGVFLLLISIVSVGTAPVPGGYDYTPKVPEVVVELTASAKLQLNEVPDDVTKVWVQSKELNDLTGNFFEDGFEFGFDPSVPYIYYPELDSGKSNVFRLMVFSEKWGWSSWSEESPRTHILSSRYMIYDLERNWHDAKSYCLNIGKHLAMPKNEKQSELLLTQYKSLFSGTEDSSEETAWIGLYDENYNVDDQDKSSWKWVDGTILGNYNKFEYGASDQSVIETSAVGLRLDGYWETDDPTEKHLFICETLQNGEELDTESERNEGIDGSILLNRVKRD